MSTKLKFELDKVKVNSNALAISDSSAKAMAQKVFEDVTDGKISAITAMEAFALMGKVHTELKDMIDESGKVTMNDLIREEIKINLNGNKEYVTPKGTKFKLAETGTKYDYSSCGDPIYTSLVEKKDKVSSELKKREEFLKSISDFIVMSIPDPETGELLENITITAPSKTSNSSYTVTLLKG